MKPFMSFQSFATRFKMKKVLFAASECVPFIKTGGLADVCGALPKQFDKEEWDVRVVISTPRTPQQNGVVERKNRTLQEMARTMLNENNLPKYFWAEAVNTSCYVLNRI